MGNRRWGWKKKALLQLLLLPIWLLTAELLLRGGLWIGGKPYRADEARTSISAAATGMTQLAALPRLRDKATDPAMQAFYKVWHAHPYYGFEDYSQLPQVGAQAAVFQHPRDPREYTVMLVGGSVAWLLEPEGTKALEQKLLEDPRLAGRKIKFLNYARPSYKQPQQLMEVAYLFNLGILPDAVVNLDGFNEAAFAWSNIQNGVHPIYPDIGIWGHASSGDPNDRTALDLMLDIREMQVEVAEISTLALNWRFYESSILGRLTLSRLGRRTARATKLRKSYVDNLISNDAKSELRGPRVAGGVANALKVAVRVWVEASRSLQDLCRGRSILYVHVLQPTRHDIGSKPLAPEELASGGDNPYFIESVHALYPRLREAGIELRSLGVNFLDASMCFAELKEPVYYDHCHFKGAGNELVAARIAECLLRALPPR